MVEVAGEMRLLHKLPPTPPGALGDIFWGPWGPMAFARGRPVGGGVDQHSRLEEPKAGGMSGQRHTVRGCGMEKGREAGGGVSSGLVSWLVREATSLRVQRAPRKKPALTSPGQTA